MPDASPGPQDGADWPAQAASTIVRLVEQVRDKTTRPAEKATRGIVYGTLAGLAGVMVLVLLPVFLVRLEVEAIEGVHLHRRVWLAHAVNALLFTVLGMWIWSKRRPRTDDA